MTNENRDLLRKLIGDEQNDYMSMDKVCNAIKKRMKSGKDIKDENKQKVGFDYDYEVGKLYAELVDKNWKLVMGFTRKNMPHVIFNGDTEPTVCDFVKIDDKSKAKRFFKVYQTVEYQGKGKDRKRVAERHDLEGETSNVIFVSTTENKTETVTLASGWPIEVPSRDEKGNIITKTVEVMMMPREKGVWGFSETLVDAFIQAIEDLEVYLAEEEAKKKAEAAAE